MITALLLSAALTAPPACESLNTRDNPDVIRFVVAMEGSRFLTPRVSKYYEYGPGGAIAREHCLFAYDEVKGFPLPDGRAVSIVGSVSCTNFLGTADTALATGVKSLGARGLRRTAHFVVQQAEPFAVDCDIEYEEIM